MNDTFPQWELKCWKNMVKLNPTKNINTQRASNLGIEYGRVQEVNSNVLTVGRYQFLMANNTIIKVPTMMEIPEFDTQLITRKYQKLYLLVTKLKSKDPTKMTR